VSNSTGVATPRRRSSSTTLNPSRPGSITSNTIQAYSPDKARSNARSPDSDSDTP
jgi:hypothetical protein